MISCKLCGAEFERGRTTGYLQIYCGNKCRNRAYIKHKQKTPHVCECCSKEYLSARDSQRFCSKECRAVVASQERMDKYYANLPKTKTITCRWCEQDYTGPFGSTPHNKMHPKCATQAKQARYRIKTVKRQGKIVSRTVMTVEKLVERDGDNCFICQEVIDLSLPRTNRYGATVEHVVPLKRGGADEPDNLRLAHWICNVRKGSKLMEEMNG